MLHPELIVIAVALLGLPLAYVIDSVFPERKDEHTLTTEEVRLEKVKHAYAIGRIATTEELEASIEHVLVGGWINQDGTLPGTPRPYGESIFPEPTMEETLK